MESIFQSIEILSKEKGIDSQIVLDAVKDAMLIAARKHFRTNEDYVADIDEKSGSLKLFAIKKVVEAVADPAKELLLRDALRIDPAAAIGNDVRIPTPTDALGRISAQTAKQVIFQKVREAERETVFQEYSGRAGELVNCTVKRIEGPDLILDLGKTEARLPKKEQSRLENFGVGDRVRCVIKIVDKSAKGPGVVVSRADPELVKRLFEQEVPEIYDGTVVIKGCAREAGERTKIAVFSRDRDVDCVGACVGMKGMRVQSIIRELRGEKIDIIEFSEDPVQFATHALSPAKISRVTIIEAGEKHMEVIVDDSQLSLAIGKKGQNVRLAAKLLGWKIDIKSEEEKRQEVESAMAALVVPGDPVSALIDYGLGREIADKLIGAGISTIEQLGSMTPEQLEEIPGFGLELESVQAAVNNYYGQFEQSGETQQAEGAGSAESEDVAGSAESEDVAGGAESEDVAGGAESEDAAVSAEAGDAADSAESKEAAGSAESVEGHAGDGDQHLSEATAAEGEAPAGEAADTIRESAANDSDTISSSASSEEHVAEEGNSSRQSSEHRSPEE